MILNSPLQYHSTTQVTNENTKHSQSMQTQTWMEQMDWLLLE